MTPFGKLHGFIPALSQDHLPLLHAIPDARREWPRIRSGATPSACRNLHEWA
jgi:hypothetical protein